MPILCIIQSSVSIDGVFLAPFFSGRHYSSPRRITEVILRNPIFTNPNPNPNPKPNPKPNPNPNPYPNPNPNPNPNTNPNPNFVILRGPE